MVIYNAVAAGVFIYAALEPGLNGLLPWPDGAFHAVMTAWCVAHFVGRR
jgi:hypothetical protein